MSVARDPAQLLLERFGPEVVKHSPAYRRVYDSDAYPHEAAAPDVVALPRSQDELVAVVRACHELRLPFAPRGAGTGLAGGCVLPGGGVQIGVARLDRIVAVDPVARTAVVEPGVVNLALSRAVAQHGLHFAPDPSSQVAATIGGNVANNSGGPHTLKYGVTLPHVLGLRWVLPDGEVVELGGDGLPRGGIDLLGLACGSEGTLGIAARVTVRLTPLPDAVRTFLLVYDEVAQAARMVSRLIASGVVPAAMELIDQLMLGAVEDAFGFGFPRDAGAVLIVELDGAGPDVEAGAARLREVAAEAGLRELREASGDDERAQLWKARKHAFGAIGRLAPNYATQDGVVPRARTPEIVARIAEVADRHGLRIGNVLHAGDGNIHPLILYDRKDPAQLEAALAACDDIMDACIALEGSPTGEHGIGLEKTRYMERLFGPDELEAMAELKAAFDPDGRCNPGKVLPAGGHCAEPDLRSKQVPQ